MAPVLFFSGLIYPEVPAALISLLVFRHILLKRDARPWVILGSGLGLAFLPWLGLKYGVLAAVLLVLAAAPWLKSPRGNAGKLVRLSLPLLVSVALLLVFAWSLFGSLNPAQIYAGSQPLIAPSQVRPGRPTTPSAFLGAALGPFFDQNAGLFVYAPVYFLAVAGFILLWKRRRSIAAALMILTGSHFLLGAATFYLGGYAPPGRPLLPVTWALGAGLAFALSAPTGRLGALVKSLLAGMSAIVAGLALSAPALVYHHTVSPKDPRFVPSSDFLHAAGNIFFDPRRWTPALERSGGMPVWPFAAWLAVLAAVTALILWPRTRTPAVPARFGPKGRLAVVLSASILFLAAVFSSVRLDTPTALETGGPVLYFQDENQFGLEQGGFWTKGGSAASIVIGSPSPLSSIVVSLSSAARGEAEVGVDRYRVTARHDPRRAAVRRLEFPSPRGFAWKGSYLYTLKVRERSPFVPHDLDGRSPDGRTLGVFVRISGW